MVVKVEYKDNRPTIRDKPVFIPASGKVACHTRLKGSRPHPDADFTIPHRRNRNLVVDIIILIGGILAGYSIYAFLLI